jgi:glutamate-1-semialdehyde 2,1-aminomutase
MPAPGFFETIRKTCDEQKAIMICDDVRASMRLNLGGSCEYFNYRPDMICLSKAVANGHPLAICGGRKELMPTGSSVYLTGTYWSASPPLAAAMATLDELEEKKGIDVMFKMGTLFTEGLVKTAGKHGLQLRISGPPSIPFMTFANETSFRRNQVFAAEATKRGAFIHPHHNWFISAAHTEDDINKALEIADVAFKIVKEKFGS